VSPRIEEILLQQQVNLVFDEWLTNMRRQGDVEVLDSALVSAVSAAPVSTPASPETLTAAKGKGSQ
jgi:adenosylmethionine-8-amino-7-oxononanoate aminotransferase